MWPLVGLGAAVAVAAGGAAALAVVPRPAPPALVEASPAGEVHVSTRTFDDSRTVELTLEVGAERRVTSPASGVVTEATCRPGGVWKSGERIAAIDGSPIIGLASAEPLWRDIAVGDAGDDIRGFQAELGRLGSPVVVDGIAGRETIRAAQGLLAAAAPERRGAAPTDAVSGGDAPGVVPMAAFAWLPAPEVTVSGCPAITGGRVESGEPLADLPVALTRVRTAGSPVDLVAGPRVLTAAGVDLGMPGEGGVIADSAALATLAATPEYAMATAPGGTLSLTGTLALRTPPEVVVVPPAALYGVRGDTGCLAVPVVGGNRALKVAVVASELGETLVIPDGDGGVERVALGGGRPSCH